MLVGFQSEKKEQPLTNLFSCADLHVDVRHSTGGSDAQMMLQMVQIDRYCRDTPTVPPAPVTSPLPPSVEFLQSLAGLVRLCPAPCRCYGLEHSTSAKWGNWSQLDLWLLDPPQLNRPPPLHLLPPSFPLCPPSPSLFWSLPPHPPLPSIHFVLSLLLGVREPITSWFIVWFMSGDSPQPLCGPILSVLTRNTLFLIN